MKKTTRDRRSYKSVLKALARTHPKIASHLSIGEGNRESRLKRYFGGVRLRGLEELLTHLEEMERCFNNHHRLSKIAFLLRRVRENYVTAVETALTGIYSVTFDAMREVMEVEFLLRDFRYSTDHIEIWLSSDDKQRNDFFRPALLRQRHAFRLGKPPQDMGEAADYKMHSYFLHVNPGVSMFSSVPGISNPKMLFGDDAVFWDMYEHARRVLVAIHAIRRRVAPRMSTPLGPDRGGMKHFEKGWVSTQQMQYIAFSLLNAALEKEGAEETT